MTLVDQLRAALSNDYAFCGEDQPLLIESKAIIHSLLAVISEAHEALETWEHDYMEAPDDAIMSDHPLKNAREISRKALTTTGPLAKLAREGKS